MTIGLAFVACLHMRAEDVFRGEPSRQDGLNGSNDCARSAGHRSVCSAITTWSEPTWEAPRGTEWLLSLPSRPVPFTYCMIATRGIRHLRPVMIGAITVTPSSILTNQPSPPLVTNDVWFQPRVSNRDRKACSIANSVQGPRTSPSSSFTKSFKGIAYILKDVVLREMR